MAGLFGFFTRKKSVQNAVGLSDEALGLLAKDFRKLKKAGSHLPDKALRYAVDGTDEEVLGELRRAKGTDEALQLWCATSLCGLPDDVKGEFYRKTNVSDPAFYVRLAQIYEAAAAPSPNLRASQYIPGWFEIFLMEVTNFQEQHKVSPSLSAPVIEDVAAGMGSERGLLVHAAFLIDFKDPCAGGYPEMCVRFAGFAESAARNPEPIKEALSHKKAAIKVQALRIIEEHKIAVDLFKEELTAAALSSAEAIRNAAMPVAKANAQVLVPLVREKVASGSPDERANAVKLLTSMDLAGSRQFLQERLQEEKSEKVRQEIENMLRAAPSESAVQTEAAPAAAQIRIGPAPELQLLHPLSGETFEHFSELVDRVYKERSKHHNRTGCAALDSLGDILQNVPKKAQVAFDLMQGIGENPGKFETYKGRLDFGTVYYLYHPTLAEFIKKFVARPELNLVHVVRFLVMSGGIRFEQNGSIPDIPYPYRGFLKSYYQSHGGFTLAELASACEAAGISRETAAWAYLHGSLPDFRLKDEDTCSFFAERIDILEELFGLRPSRQKISTGTPHLLRKRAFASLAAFPEIPVSVIPAVLESALTGGKAERPYAARCLEKLPDRKERLIEALKAGKQDIRAGAAEMLARLGAKDAVPAIQAALKKEKQDVARAGMMNALETLGVPLEEIISAEDMLKDAQAGLAKGIPDQLSWFPFENIPAVHWQKTGEQVHPDIPKWWIVQHYKFGEPEPGPLLKRYCSLLKPDDREALGKFVLSTWIGQDTLPKYTQQEAMKHAEDAAKNYVKYYPEMSYDRLYAKYLKQFLEDSDSKAVKEKGILAITGACGGVHVAPTVERYLKKWYGWRSAQCKALLHMLMGVDDKNAIQLLLATSARFRTKGIREEAEACVKTIAERNNWSLAELADRTIPSAGFEDGPEMTLDYGTRTFTARLGNDLKIVLRNENGEIIDSLPDARKDEDEDTVKEAKQLLSDAKKQVKSILSTQKDRLYEAMCAQRTWNHEDWRTYLLQHPVVGYYCQSIVWKASDNGSEVTFRPMDDGTLTDCRDNLVTLSDKAVVSIAHSTTVNEEEKNAWLEHLKDYEITPLFDQFTKPVYTLPEDKKNQTEIKDFEGYVLGSFKLRSKATALGYIRSSSEDGGWFYQYVKRFPGTGFEAIISFTGSPLPEEDITVALEALSFIKAGSEDQDDDDSGDAGQALLAEIPPVMLSECYNDMRIIAAEGPGFDKEWKKNIGW